MDAIHLIEYYSYGVDTSTVVLCTVLLVLINFVLYFSTDKKFSFLKRTVYFVLVGAMANIAFAFTCEHSPENTALIFIFRDIYHGSLMSCMFIFMLYIKYMLEVKGPWVKRMTYFTRVMLAVCFLADMFSPITHIGFYKDEAGWHDALFSPYNVFYVYGVLLLMGMLIFYNHRIIHSVRLCLIITEAIIALIMIKGGMENSNTYTSFTYILPIIVVMILLHSKPFDDETGAMSSRSLESFIERYVRKGIHMDFMVLHLRMDMDNRMPTELGKVLTNFWHEFFAEANFFMAENGVYILVIPRIKKNGNTEEKIHQLFYERFPGYFAQFNMPYKVIGMSDFDFVKNWNDLKNIINYLFLIMEDNDILIVDQELKSQVRIMRSVKEHLVDIEKQMNLDDERVLVYCQPVMNMKTGKYDTAEALMRLQIPEQGVVLPHLFIPLAESFGHIHALTKVMIHKVCKQMKTLEEEGYDFKRVSVNVAVSELRDEKFCKEVIDIIKGCGIDPAKVGIELTESQNENDFKIVRDKITYLKTLGMTFYLDDFGTGYSNLDRILKLGLDVIKYDRSILLAAEKDPNVSYMVQHFAEALKQFDYKLLFEGVETQEHIDICGRCNADYLQGFKYSKPIPMEQMRSFFEKKQN